MFWCLILNSFSIFVAERCRTKKFAVVGNGSHGRMWRRNPFWRQRRCVRVRKDGFVKRMLSTALWSRLLLKALVDFCFPGAGWCTYVRGSAFWDLGGRWGRICGPPRVEIRQFAFLEEVCVNVLDKRITQWMPGWGGAVLTFRARWSRSGCFVGVGVGWGGASGHVKSMWHMGENLQSAFGALEPFGWPKRSPQHVPDNAVHDKN